MLTVKFFYSGIICIFLLLASLVFVNFNAFIRDFFFVLCLFPKLKNTRIVFLYMFYNKSNTITRRTKATFRITAEKLLLTKTCFFSKSKYFKWK